MTTYDTWNGSWGTSWGISWTRSTAPDVVLLGGGPGEETHYRHKSYSQLREEDAQRKVAENQIELRRVKEELAKAEKRKEEKIAAKPKRKNTAKKLAEIEAALQEEISALRIERARLIRLIDDEEAILVLLLSLPFH